MEKRAIRQRILSQRKLLTEEDCQQMSLRAQLLLVVADCFSSSRTLALYSPIQNEVKTEQLLLAAQASGQRVCFPRVYGERLLFVVIDTVRDLDCGAFGVAEPASGTVIPVAEIDLLVVPGVAFDRRGYRLGYGKGFYDRELVAKASTASAVGLCYDFQLCDRLPVEPHDQRLDFIVTETQIFPCHNGVAG